MPDQTKKIEDSDEPADESVQRDDLGSDVESDVPTVEPSAGAEDTVDDEAESAEGSEEALDEVSGQKTDSETEATDGGTTPFDDEKTGQAIDEIVAKEGDDILAAQDLSAPKSQVKFKAKGHGFWRNKWVRSIILLLVFGGVAAAMVYPKSRYWILNTAGVRSSSSVTVVDSTTELPLKGVTFTLGEHTAKTDGQGKAMLTGLKLGPTQLTIEQVGFGSVKRSMVVGWGSNPLGTVGLEATGVRYVIQVKDYLSDQPVEGVEATDGQATAVSDKKGKITLTLENTAIVNGGITLSKAGYRDEKITLNSDTTKTNNVAMVLARKAVFAVKSSGKYDVYKSDIDGKNKEILLPGTGNENSNVSLVVSPDGSRAAWVSTRDNKRDSDGFLLSSLVLINVGTGEKVTAAESSQIQLIDWIGTRLVFELASSDSSAGDRYKITSYNYPDNSRLQLAAANKMSAVMSAQGMVYYVVDTDTSNPSLKAGLYKIAPDGSGKQQVFDGQLSTTLRTTYGTLSLQADDGTWYTYDLAKGSKSQISSPSSLANHLYIDNADHTRSLWVGQGTLTAYDIAAAKDTAVKSQSGLTYPALWLTATEAIYRVSSGSETADYAVSVLGGSAHKVSDVTASYGFAQPQ